MRSGFRHHIMRLTSQAGSTGPLRGLIAALLVVGSLVAAAGPAAAQTDESYRNTDSGLEWSVSWDRADWDETDTGGAADLVLTSGDSTVSFLADTLYDGNATDCVDGELANVVAPAEVEDSAELEDLDLGPQDGDSLAYAGRSTTSLDEDGDEQEFATTVLCRTIVPDESVLIIYHIVTLDDFADDAPAVADLVANVAVGDDMPDEPETTPEPSDDSAAVGADEDAGTYVSPTYGYGLNWDASDWEVETDETLRTLGRDRLTLLTNDSATRVFYEGSEEWDGDLDDCVSGLVDELVNDVESDEPIELASGDTISEIEEIDDPLTGDPFESGDQIASAGYTYNIAFDDGSDQDQFIVVDCIVLDEDSGLLLGVSQVGLADDLGDEIRQRVVDITTTLTYDGDPVDIGAVDIGAWQGATDPVRRLVAPAI